MTDLRLFVAIADTGSITGGATRCHLALASASARIKALEASVGVALLSRERRGVALTSAGDSFLAHARVILHNVDVMTGELAVHARGLKTRISLLANTASLSEHLPKPLAVFLSTHRDASIDVEERESADIARGIAGGHADIGLAIETALPITLERFAFCDDNLVLIAKRGDPLLHRRRIAFTDILSSDFVGLSHGSALQSHLEMQAALSGTRLRVRARVKDLDAICQMVAGGAGIAVVPEATARRSAASLPLGRTRIAEPWARRRLVVCMRSIQTLTPPARRLVEHLRAVAPLARSAG